MKLFTCAVLCGLMIIVIMCDSSATSINRIHINCKNSTSVPIYFNIHTINSPLYTDKVFNHHEDVAHVLFDYTIPPYTEPKSAIIPFDSSIMPCNCLIVECIGIVLKESSLEEYAMFVPIFLPYDPYSHLPNTLVVNVKGIKGEGELEYAEITSSFRTASYFGTTGDEVKFTPDKATGPRAMICLYKGGLFRGRISYDKPLLSEAAEKLFSESAAKEAIRAKNMLIRRWEKKMVAAGLGSFVRVGGIKQFSPNPGTIQPSIEELLAAEAAEGGK
jgi:hypothetical protein